MLSFQLHPSSLVIYTRANALEPNFHSLSLSLSGEAMEYERIQKVQIGVISPSKLRMKLLGSPHVKKKEDGSSSRASPSKLEDMEYAKRNLLAENIEEEGASADLSVTSITKSLKPPSSIKEELSSDYLKARNQTFVRSSSCKINNTNNSTKHPVKHQDDDNASTSSFEFHLGEKMAQNPIFNPFYKNTPSKWNDAEKWLVSRQKWQANALKKNFNLPANSIWARIAPEFMLADQKASLNQLVGSRNGSHSMAEKFSIVSQGMRSNAHSSNGSSCLTDSLSSAHQESSVSDDCVSKSKDIPSKPPPVSMRDVGTEMTPIPSHEPSRTGTPFENLTPNRRSISSIPSSPRRSIEEDMENCGKMELSEKELQLKTRQEIAALGLQLGKFRIASWAFGQVDSAPLRATVHDEKERLRKEYEVRAMVWEEAEKVKRVARYKENESKIQVWESHQREKYEARMKKAEVKAAKMRSRAEAAMSGKLRKLEQRVVEKQAIAEARKNAEAERVSQQAERMRHRRGRSRRPPSCHVRCCSWLL